MIPILTLLLAMFSIQSGASLAKNLFPVAGVAGTTMFRIGFAALLLLVIWRPWRHTLKKQDGIHILLYGISLGLMNLTFYVALKRIPLGICVALEFVGPLTLALKNSKRKLDFLWALLAAMGIFYVLPGQQNESVVDWIGIIFALIAGTCWAFYIIFGQKVSATVPAGIAASLGMSVAALVVLPFGLYFASPSYLQPSTWIWGFGVAIFSSALPYSLEMISLKVIPTKTFGILMSLEPAVAAISGFAFLNEKLSALQWSAIVCIMIASLGSSLTSRKISLPEAIENA